MRPLEGVKVVDLTTFLAAPTTCRVLGEWGADVIKVEAPKGDPGRTQGAVFGMKYEDDENLGFDMSNMNKRFTTVNLKSEKGKEVNASTEEKATFDRAEDHRKAVEYARNCVVLLKNDFL